MIMDFILKFLDTIIDCLYIATTIFFIYLTVNFVVHTESEFQQINKFKNHMIIYSSDISNLTYSDTYSSIINPSQFNDSDYAIGKARFYFIMPVTRTNYYLQSICQKIRDHHLVIGILGLRRSKPVYELLYRANKKNQLIKTKEDVLSIMQLAKVNAEYAREMEAYLLDKLANTHTTYEIESCILSTYFNIKTIELRVRLYKYNITDGQINNRS